jgi:hypothetical protein
MASKKLKKFLMQQVCAAYAGSKMLQETKGHWQQLKTVKVE